MALVSASRALRLARFLSPMGGVAAASGLRICGPPDAAPSVPVRFFASKRRPWRVPPYSPTGLLADGWSEEQQRLLSQDPKGMILPDGCDSEHWVIVMDPPAPDLSRDEIVALYTDTLATVVGSKKGAKERIYSVSTNEYFAFGALLSEEQASSLKELPKIQWVLHDKYLEVKNDEYGDFKGRPAWCGEIDEDGLPTWVDWRIRGAVTPVQNQLINGPCWAFAAIAAIEAVNFLATGKLVKLSEQQLIDCNDVNNHGMDCGLMYEALQYARENGGVASAEIYPYVAKKGKCRNITTDLVTITGIRMLISDCEKELARAVSKTPVATGLEFTHEFRQYGGGILRGPNSLLKKCNHAGLVIGFDRLNKTKVWTFKDSFGTNGPHGGIKYIARDAYPAGGAFGIARYSLHPTKSTKKWPNKVGPVRSETSMGVKKRWPSISPHSWGNPEDEGLPEDE